MILNKSCRVVWVKPRWGYNDYGNWETALTFRKCHFFRGKPCSRLENAIFFVGSLAHV
jgi:hypothetical protein